MLKFIMPSIQQKNSFWRRLERKSTLYFLLLTILLGAFLFFSRLNFQAELSPERYGRDLYSFREVLNKKIPCRDFACNGNPATVFYYAVLFRLSGPTIQTAVLGHCLLIFGAGLLIFFFISSVSPPSIAFGCAAGCWVILHSFLFAKMFPDYTSAGDVFYLVLFLMLFFKTWQHQKPLYLTGLFFVLLLLTVSNLTAGMLLMGLMIFGIAVPILSWKNDPYHTLKCWLLVLLAILTVYLTAVFYCSCRLPDHNAGITGDLKGLLLLFPLPILLLSFFLDRWTRHVALIRKTAIVLFILIPLLLLCRQHARFIKHRQDQQLFELGKNRVYTLESTGWMKDVSSIARYLKKQEPLAKDPLLMLLQSASTSTEDQDKVEVSTYVDPSGGGMYEWSTVTRPSDNAKKTTLENNTLLVFPPRAMVYFLTERNIPIRSLDRLSPLGEEEVISDIRDNAVTYVVASKCRETSPGAEHSSTSYHLFLYLLHNYQEVLFLKGFPSLSSADQKCSASLFRKIR